MIIHLIGQPGAGKTTIARELAKSLGQPMLIDGDDLREIFKNKDYSEEGRRRNLTNAYNIARFVEAKGFTPVLSLVSPYRDIREELKAAANVKEIYLKTSSIRGREGFFVQDYAVPTENYLEVNTDLPLSECVEQIKKYLAQ